MFSILSQVNSFIFYTLVVCRLRVERHSSLRELDASMCHHSGTKATASPEDFHWGKSTLGTVVARGSLVLCPSGSSS